MHCEWHCDATEEKESTQFSDIPADCHSTLSHSQLADRGKRMNWAQRIIESSSLQHAPEREELQIILALF